MVNPETDTTALGGARGASPVASLPPRTAVIQAELGLARRQLEGHTRSIRYQGDILGEEIEPPAEGLAREALLGEIDRLERHLAAISTPVVMPNLVLGGSARTAVAVGSSTAPVPDFSGAGR